MHSLTRNRAYYALVEIARQPSSSVMTTSPVADVLSDTWFANGRKEMSRQKSYTPMVRRDPKIAI